jgi:hypothetical protein
MPFAVVYKNSMLDSGPPDNLSLHTASPGSTGTNEVTGGSPAYARKAPAWAASSAGSKALAATFPVFDVPASTTVTHVGFWKAGVYQGYVDVTDEVFASQGTYTITAGSIDLNATASA